MVHSNNSIYLVFNNMEIYGNINFPYVRYFISRTEWSTHIIFHFISALRTLLLLSLLCTFSARVIASIAFSHL